MAIATLVASWNRRTVFCFRALKDGLAVFLGGREFPVRQPITIRPIRQRVHVGDKVGELLLIEALRTEEELFGAWTALGGHIGIATIPFERLGASEILKQP